jgi:hypothetical protein
VVSAPGSSITRRRVLIGMLLVAPAVGGCALTATPEPTDPLIALADAARADTALAAAAITADPALAGRLRPLVDARTAHAAALDAEVARLRPGRSTPAPQPATPPDGAVTLVRVRDAARASADAAATLVPDLPVDRVGLVASVSACCAGYATVLS